MGRRFREMHRRSSGQLHSEQLRFIARLYMRATAKSIVIYHVCAKSVASSSSVTAAPGVAALMFAVLMAITT